MQRGKYERMGLIETGIQIAMYAPMNTADYHEHVEHVDAEQWELGLRHRIQ